MKIRKRYILVILLVIAAGIAGYYYFAPGKTGGGDNAAGEGDSKVLDRFYTVKRGDLVIGLSQGGSINAKKKHKLSLQASFRTKLAWIIDENTKVKTDDVLAKFETEELNDKIEDLRITCQNLEKELMIAIETEKIQISTNAADVRSAEDRVKTAEDALKRYIKFDKRKSRDSIDLKIQTAESAYNEALDTYRTKKLEIEEKSESNDEQIKTNQQTLDTLQNKVDNAKNTLDNAQQDRKVFNRYTTPEKMTELNNSLAQAKLNLRKVKVSTASNLVQKRKSISNLTTQLKKNQTRLKTHESYLPMMEMKAPVDGVVIYGDPDRRWGNPDIKPGMDVWKNMILLTIPDMNNLVVDFDLPEQYRTKVKVGDKAIITPESIPNLKVSGSVSKIATLPVNQIYWDSNSPKVYRSVISLEKQTPRLVSGMNVQLDIVTKVIKDTLFVPVEAIFDKNDKFFVYKQTPSGPKITFVSIGATNDNYAQILEGLEEKDVVYLYKPFQKKQDAQ